MDLVLSSREELEKNLRREGERSKGCKSLFLGKRRVRERRVKIMDFQKKKKLKIPNFSKPRELI